MAGAVRGTLLTTGGLAKVSIGATRGGREARCLDDGELCPVLLHADVGSTPARTDSGS
jgi:hypothetical protein